MKRRFIHIYILAVVGLVGAVSAVTALSGMAQQDNRKVEQMKTSGAQDLEVATFAGGCFWCVESDFEKVDGVVRVISGYTGGSEPDPTYHMVSSGKTGHLEAVQVHYDPKRISYQELLDVFWKHIDPTDPGGQFVDRGKQYRTAIFYHNAEQKRLAEASRDQLDRSGRFSKPIVTQIIQFDKFYPAEDYHQDFFKKSPIRYKTYRHHSGRDQFIQKTWGHDANTGSRHNAGNHRYAKPSDEQLRHRLTPLQYHVVRENGTEPPFNNAYWDHKQQGIYVDIVSGEPLFSSTDKFNSGTGWPSFTKPIDPDHIVEKKDVSHFMVRTEVRSKHGDAHLGHVFDDGPAPTGLRYCINSAALRFIPVEDLEKEGYGEWLRLFTQKKD